MMSKISIPKDHWLGQLVRFTGVGAIGTAVDFTIFALLVLLIAGLPEAIATGISATFGAIVNYFLNYKFTFDTDKSHKDALPKFMLIAMIAVLMNIVLMFVLHDLLGITALLAKIIATGVVFFITFMGNKLWTFAERSE